MKVVGVIPSLTLYSLPLHRINIDGFPTAVACRAEDGYSFGTPDINLSSWVSFVFFVVFVYELHCDIGAVRLLDLSNVIHCVHELAGHTGIKRTKQCNTAMAILENHEQNETKTKIGTSCFLSCSVLWRQNLRVYWIRHCTEVPCITGNI